MKNTFVSYNVRYGNSGYWFQFQKDGKDYQVGPGYAHFLEHLLGEHSQFGDMYHNFDQRFQASNAYTDVDVTSYHFQGKDQIEKSIEELIRSIEQPVFDQKDVDASRHAIGEEAASKCDDSELLLVCMVDNNLYDGFSKFDKSYSPIGTRKTTNGITLDHLYDCYDAFYTDNSKFLVIAGPVEEERLVEFLNNIYATLPKHEPHVILPNYDLHGMRSPHGVLYRNVEAPLYSLGIKVQKPDFLTMKEFNYVMSILRKQSYHSKAVNDMFQKGIVDSYGYCVLTNVEDYINYLVSFSSVDKNACIDRLLELFNKKEFSKKEYELMKRGIIASEIRDMEDKYDYVEDFPGNISVTEDYTDIGFYQSVSYDAFMQMLSALNFDQYTVGELKPYQKTK